LGALRATNRGLRADRLLPVVRSVLSLAVRGIHGTPFRTLPVAVKEHLPSNRLLVHRVTGTPRFF
jgi:hypothetical protein